MRQETLSVYLGGLVFTCSIYDCIASFYSVIFLYQQDQNVRKIDKIGDLSPLRSLTNADQQPNSQFLFGGWGLKLTKRVKVVVLTCHLMQPGGPIRQPYAGVNFIPPVRGYELGYWRYIHTDRRCLAYSMSELHPANIQCKCRKKIQLILSKKSV